MSQLATADLCDQFPDEVKVARSIFTDYGKKKNFGGEIRTVKVFEDNVLVKKFLEENGKGKVLVVDGGASLKCALLGGNLTVLAKNNGWEGVIINGCIRDTVEISAIEVGVKALNTCPMKSIKKGEGEIDVQVNFAGVAFHPGEFVYADLDGVIVAKKKLVIDIP